MVLGTPLCLGSKSALDPGEVCFCHHFVASFPPSFSFLTVCSDSEISGVETYCQYVQLLFGSLNIAYLMTSLSLSPGKVPRTACLHAWIPLELSGNLCTAHSGLLRILKIHFFQYFFSFWRRNHLTTYCSDRKGPGCALPLHISIYWLDVPNAVWDRTSRSLMFSSEFEIRIPIHSKIVIFAVFVCLQIVTLVGYCIR